MGLLKKFMQVILLLAMIFLFVALGIPVGVIIAYWNDLPSLEPLEYGTQSWYYPTKVYSDISRVCPGMSLENLLKKLKRLDYNQVSGEPTSEGQFYLKEPVPSVTNEMKLYLRELNYPRLALPSRLIATQIKEGKIAEIRSADETSLSEFVLEPEVIAEFYGSEGTDRELVSLSQVPEVLSRAFIAIEDKRFFRHWGFDPYRIMGVLYLNIKHRRIVQGASTITQQLARDLFLTKRQLWSRKVKEGLLAIKIERKYTKDEILERYLNRINLGRYGSREVYGVGQAARYYFGKDPWELNLQECATLAAIPRDQTRYSPIRNPENALRRRQLVLRQMLEEGFITKSRYEEAVASPLVTASAEEQSSNRHVMYFLEYIRGQLEREYEPSAIHRRGLAVYTTLDMSMQLAADSAVQMGLRMLDRDLKFPPYDENKTKWLAGEHGKGVENPEEYLQGALVSVDPSTGYIKAMVGGRDFYVNQFNRAVQSRRQPGSAFKPFVYCAAFANNLATPTSIVVDEPWGVEVPDGRWEPENFYDRFYGQVTVRKMLAKSINVATARFFYEKVGPDKVIDIAKAMGIKSPLDAVPSLALGSSGVSVLEITSAYGVWANQGMYVEPLCIKYVLDREGNIREENISPARRVLDENVAFQMTYLMKGVVQEGTGRRLTTVFGFDKPAAGKTGTTNDETDAWFIGFVPGLVAGVWVGFDDYSKSIGYTGALAALPIWYDFMKSVVDEPVKDFPVPEGIVFKQVDADTGLPATSGSTNVIREAFLRGTEPRL
jgi:1A family penicillin-binding protein